MSLYLGVDLGTSGVKVILVNESGVVLNAVTKEYELHFPHPGWAEENAADWWDMTKGLVGYDQGRYKGGDL